MLSRQKGVSSMSCSTEVSSAEVLCGEGGQTTVEAAFALPILFFAFALLLQPAVLLYDRCVMQSAAAEACRLQATQSCGEGALKAFVERRLAALPPLDLFHTSGCPWNVSAEGGDCGAQASVSVEGHVKTLPIVGIAASTLTESAGDGCALMRCEATSALSPGWLNGSSGGPDEWIAQWE